MLLELSGKRDEEIVVVMQNRAERENEARFDQRLRDGANSR